MACDYYIGNKKYSESEFKEYLSEGGYNDFLKANHIDPSKFVNDKSENKEAVSIEDKNKEVVDSEIKKLNDERNAEIKKIGKPDLKMQFVSAKELVDSKDPIGNKEKHNVIKEKFKELKRVMECL